MQVRTLASAALGALVVMAHLDPAAAKPRPAVVDASRAIPLRADTLKRLRSGDAAQIKGALDDVRTLGKAGARAAAAIAELLAQGLSPDMTQAAIDTLGDTEAAAGSEALSVYAHHRNVALRRAAVQALARTKGAQAGPTLRAALSDPDPVVRGLAAAGLGNLKARDAVGDLFVSLDHKVAEAAASIGQLCANEECERLAGKLGSVPFDIVTSGLDQVLFRPSRDVSDDIKVEIVGRLRDVGTGEAHRFLRDVQGKWPKAWSARVRRAIDQAALATSASPGSGAAP